MFTVFFLLTTFSALSTVTTVVYCATEGTVISEVVNGHTTFFFSVKADDNINKWTELDFDRLQIDVYINGTVEAVIIVFWDDFFFIYAGIHYNVKITDVDTGDVARHPNIGDSVAIFGVECLDGSLKILVFGDFNYKVTETYKIMLQVPTINYPYNLTVTYKRIEGNEDWHVDFLEKTTESFNWAEEPRKNIWQALYDGIKSILPSDAQKTLDSLKDAFTDIAYFVKSNGLALINLGFSIYALAWIYKVVECIKTLNPSPLLDFVFFHIHLITAFFNFMLNLIKTIAGVIESILPF